METFKQLMGFTLLAAALWLLGTLQAQVTPASVQWFLAFLLTMSVALWAMQRFAGLEHSNLRRRLVQLAAAGGIAAAAWGFVDLEKLGHASPPSAGASVNETPVVVDGKINWAAFNPKAVATALERGRPVFMDYTAEWCANCKTNEKLFIETEPIRADLTRTKILPMKADYTNEDDVIQTWMEKLKREAIPIYVIYYPDGSHHLLPEVITTEMLSNALAEAARKYPPEQFKAPPLCPPQRKAQKEAPGEPGTADDANDRHAAVRAADG